MITQSFCSSTIAQDRETFKYILKELDRILSDSKCEISTTIIYTAYRILCFINEEKSNNEMFMNYGR